MFWMRSAIAELERWVTFKNSTNTTPSKNKDGIILQIPCFIEFGSISVQFAAGVRRVKCSAIHSAKQLQETLPLEFVEGPETLPANSYWHVGKEHANLSSDILLWGSCPYTFFGKAEKNNEGSKSRGNNRACRIEEERSCKERSHELTVCLHAAPLKPSQEQAVSCTRNR